VWQQGSGARVLTLQVAVRVVMRVGEEQNKQGKGVLNIIENQAYFLAPQGQMRELMRRVTSISI